MSTTCGQGRRVEYHGAENTGGGITVLLTSCLTGLDESVLQLKTKIVSCHTVKQEVNGTVILPPLAFPAWGITGVGYNFAHKMLD